MSLLACLVFPVTTGLFVGADEPTSPEVRAELEKLQGTWQLVSAETDGKKLDEDKVKKIRVVIKGRTHSVFFGDDAIAKEIPFTIDLSQKPKATTDRLPDGQEVRGIYQLDGEQLTSCVAKPGKERPREFSAKAGSGQTLRVFKRVKS